jgi:hypothetical protein
MAKDRRRDDDVRHPPWVGVGGSFGRWLAAACCISVARRFIVTTVLALSDASLRLSDDVDDEELVAVDEAGAEGRLGSGGSGRLGTGGGGRVGGGGGGSGNGDAERRALDPPPFRGPLRPVKARCTAGQSTLGTGDDSQQNFCCKRSSSSSAISAATFSKCKPRVAS